MLVRLMKSRRRWEDNIEKTNMYVWLMKSRRRWEDNIEKTNIYVSQVNEI